MNKPEPKNMPVSIRLSPDQRATLRRIGHDTLRAWLDAQSSSGTNEVLSVTVTTVMGEVRCVPVLRGAA
jgi:hypothetical protein